MKTPRCIQPLKRCIGRVLNVNKFLASAKACALAARDRRTRQSGRGASRGPLRRALVISCSYEHLPESALSTREALTTATPAPAQGVESQAEVPQGAPVARGPAPAVTEDPFPRIGNPDGPPVPRGRSMILRRANTDGDRIEEMLKVNYGFPAGNIERLADDGRHTAPTADNIREAIIRLCDDVRTGDNLVFAFIGHGGQKEGSSDGTEYDGRDELIFAIGNEEILDDELYDLLVDRLPGGAKLTAIFDCCHSGTALDLSYSSEHPDYVLPANRTVTLEDVEPPVSSSYRNLIRSISKGRFLSGRHRADNARRVARTVISISACRDSQNAYEFKNGYSLTDLIVRFIDKDGPTTICTLMAKLRHKYAYIDKLIRDRPKLPYLWTGQEPQFSSNHSLDEAEKEHFIAAPPSIDSKGTVAKAA
ncbi:hypothetical protein AURDEDRAFT_185914 [Auricularia subglabra TFB-10046 SS5]|nr:hypothetical protein AURDEDRAFT_185914 [Auricularia subglabra TFB-10046 SS5]